MLKRKSLGEENKYMKPIEKRWTHTRQDGSGKIAGLNPVAFGSFLCSIVNY